MSPGAAVIDFDGLPTYSWPHQPTASSISIGTTPEQGDEK
jgi:hypothetical protein